LRLDFEKQKQRCVLEKRARHLSDALQLLSVKHGRFCKLAKESKTILITSDKALAKAAKSEDLRVWNCEKKSEPPDC
jgi:rRNA-processing protein FCF1